VNNVRQLGQAFSRDLARFFETYNELRGRSFVMLGLKGAAVAVSLIRLGQKKSS
jgi:inorganic pyrophosphatase